MNTGLSYHEEKDLEMSQIMDNEKKHIDEQLRELGYDPDMLEMRASVLVKTLKENIQLKSALKKEQQDHYYTRCSWEETTKDRDILLKNIEALKDRIKIMNAIIHPNE